MSQGLDPRHRNDRFKRTNREKIAKRGGGGLRAVMAGSAEPEQNGARHGNDRAAQPYPVLSIKAGVTSEVITGALQAQPHLRVIHRERASDGSRLGDRSPCFEERARNGRRGQDGRETTISIGIFARHKAGLSPCIRKGKGFKPDFYVEIIRTRLIAILELIRYAADTDSPGADIVSSSDRCDRPWRLRVAHGRGREGDSSKRGL